MYCICRYNPLQLTEYNEHHYTVNKNNLDVWRRKRSDDEPRGPEHLVQYTTQQVQFISAGYVTYSTKNFSFPRVPHGCNFPKKWWWQDSQIDPVFTYMVDMHGFRLRLEGPRAGWVLELGSSVWGSAVSSLGGVHVELVDRSRVRVSAGHFSVKTLEKFLTPMVSPGWVTVIRVNHLSHQPPRSTQPSIPPGSVNEYQLRLESKGRYGSFR